MIKRDLEKELLRYKKFPVIAILGPRQSGKTTLAKNVFTNYVYINAEKLDDREFIKNDPNKFLRYYENDHGIIIDEFQHVPELLSYIQVVSDEKKRPGYFVLTGSSNFLMDQSITQSLAGRVGILTLLPLSINELQNANLLKTAEETLLNGFYPRVWADGFLPDEMYRSYIHSYIEKDVRQLVNIGDLALFQKFMQLCAARIGQLLNITDLAVSCGVCQKTVERWLSVLEASYIIFRLQPYYNNFSKRVVQKPKIYFYDTGLACFILGLESTSAIVRTPFMGHLFENMIIGDLEKQFHNAARRPQLFFWRDNNGRVEVDALIKKADQYYALEIKSTETLQQTYFAGLENWAKIAASPPQNNYLIYGGELTQERTAGNMVGWRKAGQLVADIYQDSF